METDEWLRLKGLFHEALDLPSAERTAFLQARCANDATLRQRVDRLLEASEHDATAISRDQVSDPTRATITPNSQPTDNGIEACGGVIGPYKLLQEIGAGGFGSVYMAEQEAPLRRRVALKIIKPGMDSREVAARFEQERQALALMDHPNIARVIDGGATATGRPYFVMELVRGVPVTEFCNTHRLGIRARLDLFGPICAAVQHAHQKGVIHRDIKPSNVLVAMLDGRPHIKVIDFGVAKAVRERLTDKTLFTNFHQIIGTPQYMSPEQADGSVDIDTRSDVYSLGVLLYELLTGTTPFDEAEPFVNEAIDIYTQIFGEAHSQTAYAIHVRGDLHLGRCEYAAAERDYRHALGIFRNVFDGPHRAIATELESVALARLELQDFDGAEALFREMLDHRRRLSGEDNLDYAMALNNFGVFLTRIAKFDEAADAIEHAIRLAEGLAGRNSPLPLTWRRNRAGMFSVRGDSDGALRELRELVSEYETAPDPNPVDVALAREQLGEQLTVAAHREFDVSPADARRLSEEGRQLLVETLPVMSAAFPADHWNVIRTRCALADNLAEWAWNYAGTDMEQARSAAQQARARAQEAFDAAASLRCVDPYTLALLKSRLGAANVAFALTSAPDHPPSEAEQTEARDEPVISAAERLLLDACDGWKRIGLRSPNDRRSLRLTVTWLGRLHAVAPGMADDPQRAAILAEWQTLAAD